jgi:predicted metal-dependent hydrolase
MFRFDAPLLNRKPDPAYLDIEHQGQIYKIAFRRRKAARKMILRVSSATGEAALTVPPRVDVQTVQIFAQNHSGWLALRLAKLAPRIPFSKGAIIPYRGLPHTITHWSSAPGITQVFETAEGENILAVAGTETGIARRVKLFLQKQAKVALEEAVKHYSRKIGIHPRTITLRDTKSRWGSCSSKGNLNFSWRLILSPPFVLDYLAAHEVAHLREMNHSPRFWHLLNYLCPHVEDAEYWLKKNGASLHRYG